MILKKKVSVFNLHLKPFSYYSSQNRLENVLENLFGWSIFEEGGGKGFVWREGHNSQIL